MLPLARHSGTEDSPARCLQQLLFDDEASNCFFGVDVFVVPFSKHNVGAQSGNPTPIKRGVVRWGLLFV